MFLRGGVILLTNNRNSISLFNWLNRRVPTQIYSDAMTLDMLEGCQPSLVVSYNYTHIVSEEILSFMNGNIINLHISCLPWNRGANPNLWSFLEDTPKGVTIHRMEKGLDTGAILYQREMFFDETKETLASTYQKLNEEIVRLFQEHWTEIWEGTYPVIPQQGKGSYHELKDMRKLLHDRKIDRLDWNMTIRDFKKVMLGDCTNEYARAKEALHHS